MLSGELEVELIPTRYTGHAVSPLVMECPAVFTPAGLEPRWLFGKEVRNFNGKDYLMEYAFDAPFAIIKSMERRYRWKFDLSLKQPKKF